MFVGMNRIGSSAEIVDGKMKSIPLIVALVLSALLLGAWVHGSQSFLLFGASEADLLLDSSGGFVVAQ